jgi:hypothetical protein
VILILILLILILVVLLILLILVTLMILLLFLVDSCSSCFLILVVSLIFFVDKFYGLNSGVGGCVFGPAMLCWFYVIGVCCLTGVYSVWAVCLCNYFCTSCALFHQ